MSSDGNSPMSLLRKKYIGGGGSMTGISLHQDIGDTFRNTYGSPPQLLEKTYSVATSNSLESRKSYLEGSFMGDSGDLDTVSETLKVQFKDSSSEAFRVSLSSMISSSSHGSGQDDGEALGDVYMWGEGLGDGLLGGGSCRAESGFSLKMDSLLPKHLESAVVLDVHNIACGRQHAALVSRQGEVFCWGQESGGRLGHGVDSDVAHPQLVETLVNTCVEQVACGEYHTCAVTITGDLYTWGDGTRSFGLLGQGNDFSHWMPRRVHLAEGIRISSVACGPWHTAVITSAGQLFTFGDGTFGALGHGNRASCSFPKEVESLKGLRTVRVACGVWHTAAVVEVIMAYSENNACPAGKLFTWGDADKGRLGHGDKELKSVPTCVAALVDYDFRQVACGHSLTVALTTSGTVFTMGSPAYGQLGDPHATGQYPLLVEGKLWEVFVEEIACGAHHVAVLTSKTEVYTWGKGANGRLGHGDVQDRHTPTLVEALKDKQVKSISCGSSFTAAVCLHKWLSGADQSVCSGCRFSFGFTRKRHNCYNCGHVFCHACSNKKATKATLAPSPKKPYRVCDPCYYKLKMAAESGVSSQGAGLKKNNALQKSLESKERSDRAEAKHLKVQLSLPRLPLDQSRLYGEKSPSKHSKRPESSRRVSPVPSEGSLRNAAAVSPLYDTDSSSYRHPVSPISVPPPRTFASALSPISRRSSPPRSATPTNISDFTSSEYIFEDLKRTNQSLTQEVLKLQAQVESLTERCQAQELQLQQAAKELQVANAVATEEAGKCKAAKEVIRCLTVQLKDLAEKLPPQVHDSNGGIITPLSPILDAVGVAQAANFDSIGAPEVEGICFRDQKHGGSGGNPTVRIIRDTESNGATSPYGTPNGALHLPHRMVSPHHNALRVMEDTEADRMPDGIHPGTKYVAMQGTSKGLEDSQISEKNLGLSRTTRGTTAGILDDGELSCKSTDVSNSGNTSLSMNGKHSPQHVETEWVKQHEPGVYITFTSLPGGGKDLKRVRFSRKKFSEKQAEQWWAENRVQVYEQYNVRGLNNLALGAPVAERISAA
ncbi:hypothetical protein KP509_35G058700 [Ceratopteris richardii]|nr:hypothetical protein KP509_35G058700 [Ceratopteris richardii]